MFNFLLETKAFRNDSMVEKFTADEMSEIFFAIMLTLELLSKESYTKSYTIDTVKFPLFDKLYLSTTDLGNVIACLKNAKEILNSKHVDIPVLEIKRYLRNFKYNTMNDSMIRQFFMKIQSSLRIKNGQLISLRREIVDSSNVRNSHQIANQLYNLISRMNSRLDILALLQKFLEK